jgi:Mce-associated membrane protein
MPPSHRPYRPGRQPPPASRAAVRRLRTGRLHTQNPARGDAQRPQQAEPERPEPAGPEPGRLEPGHPEAGRPDSDRPDGRSAAERRNGRAPRPGSPAPDDERSRSGEGPDEVSIPQAGDPVDGGDVGDALVQDDFDEGKAATSAPGVRVSSPLLIPAVLGVVAVALGGFALWAGVQANRLTSQPSAQNSALTDNAATSQVSGETTSAVNVLFSYNYADMASTSRAAQRLLTGAAVQQYATLFRQVDQQAARNKLLLTTRVTSSGVELLQGDRARVLIFADQTDNSAASKQVSDAGAMLAVDAVQQGGTWKIDNIDTFTSSP